MLRLVSAANTRNAVLFTDSLGSGADATLQKQLACQSDGVWAQRRVVGGTVGVDVVGGLFGAAVTGAAVTEGSVGRAVIRENGSTTRPD